MPAVSCNKQNATTLQHITYNIVIVLRIQQRVMYDGYVKIHIYRPIMLNTLEIDEPDKPGLTSQSVATLVKNIAEGTLFYELELHSIVSCVMYFI